MRAVVTRRARGSCILIQVRNTVRPNTPEGRERYLYHLNKLDKAIGALHNKLKQVGIDENTIVLFISDNGGSPRTYAENTPLKGNKYILEEGWIESLYKKQYEPLNDWGIEVPRNIDEYIVQLDEFTEEYINSGQMGYYKGTIEEIKNIIKAFQLLLKECKEKPKKLL